MKVLVTGGAGFIGSHVVDQLVVAGHEVAVVDDLSTGREGNLNPQADFHRLDIRDSGFAQLVLDLRPRAIMHLAAQIDVRRSVADPVLDADINVLGTVRLARAATAAGCERVIFSSTGGAIYGEQDTHPADESHPCRPVSPYGCAKLCAENYLALSERSGGPRFIALRYANVYGPRQDPHGEAGVVAIFCGLLLAGKQPTINGPGDQTRDYVYVADVAWANLLALETERAGIFNIGTAIETDVNQLAEGLIAECGVDVTPVHGPAQPGEQKRSCVDAGLAARELGWRPRFTLQQGLAETVAYFRNRLDG